MKKVFEQKHLIIILSCLLLTGLFALSGFTACEVKATVKLHFATNIQGSCSPMPTVLALNLSAGDRVSIEAQVNPGYRFDHWEQQGTAGYAEVIFDNDSDANTVVTIVHDASGSSNARIDITAVCEQAVNVTASVSPAGAGSVTRNPQYAFAGEQLTLTPTANSGYAFDHWEVAGAEVSSDSPYTFNLPANAQTYSITAVFDVAPASPTKPKKDDTDHEESSEPAPKPVDPNAFTGMAYNGTPAGSVKLGPQIQGAAAQLAFKAHTPVGWKEAFTFNMTVNDKADTTLKKGTLSFRIPSRYQKAGRNYAILGIDKNGKVKTFLDTDTKADTITVNLDIEGYAFDLIFL